uniref:subtilisin n=1 Tax=Chromera velia CCMP2878 TaxID=1169474 RepID=A0A0G4GTY2_9ALVE|eukprot:Cvel_23327.t1-p1 / transcript=Cvel_23327.t1 / gene=Cvel_23327 / organism=Chromera_velia_CCMP2878 / gene_product=Thermophilic serine proteinase, putative / transcript_product=Thermophilic serine proteinase, putative / location=Cvel_scaffold2390:7590-12432(-) / protein_length=514 / sequence_SO=supercontig / SO=protein_coding / is_pseudo=false
MTRLLLLLTAFVALPQLICCSEDETDTWILSYKSFLGSKEEHEGERASVLSHFKNVLSFPIKDEKYLPNLHMEVLKVPKGFTGFEILNKIGSSFPGLMHFTKDMKLYGALTSPTVEPKVSANQGYMTTGYGGWGANFEPCWELTTGEDSPLIAVVDTGISTIHPDLDQSVLDGYDFQNSRGYTGSFETDRPLNDDNGHGSHVSCLVSGEGQGGDAVFGGAPRATRKLLAAKALDSNQDTTVSIAVSALDWAIGKGAKISNNSYGAPMSEEPVALKEAVKRAGNAGMLFIAAAGNNGMNTKTSPFYPGSFTASEGFDHVINVASLKPEGTLRSDSNYMDVDLAAPGHEIFSCWQGSQYKAISGTSMAAPIVSGAAALIWSIQPTLTPAQVKTLLMDNVKKMDIDVRAGGTLDAGAACKAANATVESSSVQAYDRSTDAGVDDMKEEEKPSLFDRFGSDDDDDDDDKEDGGLFSGGLFGGDSKFSFDGFKFDGFSFDGFDGLKFDGFSRFGRDDDE